MLKTLTAGIAAIALTFATTPAQAQGLDQEDIGKLLIGLAAIAVIGAAIEEDRESNRITPVHDSRSWSGINSGSWSNLNRQHQRDIDRRRTLPSECLRTVETRFGEQPIFGQRCMERNYSHVDRLPPRCAVRVYTTSGPRQGFDPLCLREQGFRFDRRH